MGGLANALRLSCFPPMRCCIAYGSAVKRQAGGAKPGVVDFLFVVDDALSWHADNLTVHRSHYSAVGGLGADAVTRLGRLGPGVYYNTLVELPTGGAPMMCKYGVIEASAMERDCLEWQHLYVAGRLQKPVEVCLGDVPAEALAATRLAAMRTALLLLGPSFSFRDLLVQICQLSYMGDIRQGLAEAPRKVENVVDGQFTELADIYQPLLRAVEPGWTVTARVTPELAVHQDDSPETRRALFRCLPASLRSQASTYDASLDVAVLRQHLAATNRRASLVQTLKGLCTAGVVKSARYGGAKVLKRWM